MLEIKKKNPPFTKFRVFSKLLKIFCLTLEATVLKPGNVMGINFKLVRVSPV